MGGRVCNQLLSCPAALANLWGMEMRPEGLPGVGVGLLANLHPHFPPLTPRLGPQQGLLDIGLGMWGWPTWGAPYPDWLSWES